MILPFPSPPRRHSPFPHVAFSPPSHCVGILSPSVPSFFSSVAPHNSSSSGGRSPRVPGSLHLPTSLSGSSSLGTPTSLQPSSLSEDSIEQTDVAPSLFGAASYSPLYHYDENWTEFSVPPNATQSEASPVLPSQTSPTPASQAPFMPPSSLSSPLPTQSSPIPPSLSSPTPPTQPSPPPPQAPHIPRSAQSHPEDRNESHASQHSLFLARLLSLSSSLDFNSLHITVVCSNCELNPHADLGASLCYDYLNFGYCKHEYLTGICNYRHVPNNHIDAVVDRMQSGKVGVGRGAER